MVHGPRGHPIAQPRSNGRGTWSTMVEASRSRAWARRVNQTRGQGEAHGISAMFPRRYTVPRAPLFCSLRPRASPSALLLLLPRVPVAARGTVLLRGTPGCADAVAAGQVHAWTCSPARKHAGHGCSPTRLFFLLLCAFLSCRRHGEHPRPRQPAGDVTPSVARWGHPWRGLFILLVLPVWGVWWIDVAVLLLLAQSGKLKDPCCFASVQQVFCDVGYQLTALSSVM